MKIRKAYKRNDSVEVLFFKFQMLKKKFNSYLNEYKNKDFTLIGNRQELKEYKELLNENFQKQYQLKKRIEEKLNAPTTLILSK